MPPRPNKSRDLVIRPAKRRDAEAIAALARELNLHQGDPVGHFTACAVRRDFFGRGRVGVLLIAHLDGRPAGYAMLTPSYETGWAARGCYLNDIHVTEAARRRGVGRALLAAAAAHAKSQRASYMWWCSKAWNVDAQDFYRKIGAREEPVMAHALTGARFERLAAEDDADRARRKNSKRPPPKPGHKT